MAFNPKLFPTDFADNALTDEMTLEEAIALLRLEALNTARRQAHTRRIGGQNSIQNQSKLVPSRPILMPLFAVGPTPQAPPFAGIAAFLGGGRGYAGSVSARVYEFLFSNEVVSLTGVHLTYERLYMSTVGNASTGYFCGGGGNAIEELSYVRKTLVMLAEQLTAPRFGSTGGINNKVKGLICGGSTNEGFPVRTSERLTFGEKLTVTGLGNFLAAPRMSAHNAMCSATAGYIYAGSSGYHAFTSSALMSIEKINHLPETETISTLATVLTHPHHVHAAGGNAIKGYVAAGAEVTSNFGQNWFSRKITGFTYSGETVATLSAQLAEAKVCTDGISSGKAFYIVGGDTFESNWIGSQAIDRLLFSDESSSRLATLLTHPQADQGGLSDYGPAFS